MEVLDFGIYNASGTAILAQAAATKIVSINFADATPPIEETHTVPADVGVAFGYRFKAHYTYRDIVRLKGSES